MFGRKKGFLGVFFVVTSLGMSSVAFAQPVNNLVKTPPMGWNSWNVFHENINEKQIKEIADAMVSSGLRDAGYIYLNLDDNWMAKKRDASGKLTHDPDRFSSGMKALGDYIHSKGLKFGIYGDRGTRTCHHYNNSDQFPGSESGSNGREELDANTFASWGVDYLKYDNCESNPNTQEKDYTAMSNALRKSGRDIVFSICMWEYKEWMPKIANLWRTTFDIGPAWISNSWYRGVYQIIDANNEYWQNAGPGHWNDPDMLEVGNNGLSYEEQKSQMTMWSIMAAPIMISSDVRSMSAETKELYLNKEMIAINQDSLGVQGHRISDVNGKQVWTKPLLSGDIAVALLNNNSSTQTVECTFADIGVEGEVEVYDAWQKKSLGPRTSVSVELPAHGSALLRLITKPVPREPFKGNAFGIPGTIEMEDFDINGVGRGNTTYNELDSEDHGAESNGGTSYRPGTGVDIYKKATGYIVGYNRAGEWLEYSVKVAKTGSYIMYAAVASANNTSSFKLSMDGKDITEEIAVPKATTGEDNYDEYNEVKTSVDLTEGEHILRFTVTGDWMDIDYIKFCTTETCEDLATIRGTTKNAHFAVPTAESGKVFSLTGRFLGNIDFGASAATRDISASLKQAGYARGVYMVRVLGKTIRVDVKK